MLAEDQGRASGPRRHVSELYVAMLAVAMVVGSGIFKSPSLVAANAETTEYLFLAWAIGGAVSLVGALCYAELTTAFPDAGGDYHVLKRAFGRTFAFLFAWSRFAVINTGSIALLGFVFGDYMSVVLPLGPFSSAIYAAAAVAGLVWLNLRPMKGGSVGDFAMTGLEVAGVLMIAGAGVWIALSGIAPLTDSPAASGPPPAGFGYALVFALLAYGGWNEIATMSAEVRDAKRGMARALILAVVLITALYLIVAWAFWRGLGIPALAESEAPAADLMARAFGEGAAWITALAIAIATFTSINVTIITGGRITFAAARDYKALQRLGTWDEAGAIPRGAYVAQGVVALALVLFGALYDGFVTLVDYTAPIYWLFMTGAGAALIALRLKEPATDRPFRVPLYPVLPILFVLAAAAMTYSALAYVKEGALLGVAVLAAGGLVHLWLRR
jgi:amino acid transporter